MAWLKRRNTAFYADRCIFSTWRDDVDNAVAPINHSLWRLSLLILLVHWWLLIFIFYGAVWATNLTPSSISVYTFPDINVISTKKANELSWDVTCQEMLLLLLFLLLTATTTVHATLLSPLWSFLNFSPFTWCFMLIAGTNWRCHKLCASSGSFFMTVQEWNALIKSSFPWMATGWEGDGINQLMDINYLVLLIRLASNYSVLMFCVLELAMGNSSWTKE